MAAARMTTLAMMSTTQQFARLSPLTHTKNLTRNGSVLRLAAPIVSISCTLRSFSTHFLRLPLVARATELGSDDVATEAKSEDLATEFKSEVAAADAKSEDLATEFKSEDAATEADVATEEQQQLYQGSKLYVGNLPWEYDSTQLAEVIQDFGNVEVVEVVYDEDYRSRGFAFVTMASNEDARAVIKALDGNDLGGRILKVDFPKMSKNNPRIVRTVRRGRPGNVNKMFVTNFPWSCDDEALAILFSGYGTVVDAKVVYDKETGRSRGYGFVTMETAEEVQAAMESLNGADYGGRDLRVVLVEEKKPPPRQ